MFIKIENKQDLIKELVLLKGEEVVFHYNCYDCDDEQVTYKEFVDNYVLQKIEEDGYLMVGLECTNCGKFTRFLDFEYMQGIETNF